MTPEVTPDRFVVDYTGEPGERTFFIQSLEGERAATYLVEKQQVALLAEKLRDVLLMIDREDTVRAATPARDPAFALQGPLEPEWRVGVIGLGYAENVDYVVISLGPIEEDAQEEADEAQADDEEAEEERFEVRYLLRRDQARAFVLHALAIVGEGRAICQLCGLPMDPSGHRCPASNGHQVQA